MCLEKPMALKICPHEQIKLVFSSPFCLSLFFLVSVLIVFNLAIKKPKSKTNLNKLPSPPKLPIIGNLHQLGTLTYSSLRDLSLKYGNVMLLQFGQKPTLVISSAEVAMEIMKTHDLAFSNRIQTTATNILFYGCTDIGFANYGENWRQKRKICVLELLSMKRVQSFRQIREEEVDELVSKLREASSNDAYVNLSELFVETTNNIICTCSLGRKYGGASESDNRVKEIARDIMNHLSTFIVGDYFPSLAWVDVLSGKIRKIKDTFEDLDSVFDQVIEELLGVKKIENDQIKKKGFIDILLQLKEDGMLGFELSNNDIKAILENMFVGGTDTTSSTLEWAVSELVKHPTIMKKTQEEVRRVLNDNSKVEESDINQMNYLKCVVKETLRLHPVLPFLVPRETISNVKLNGYEIPEKISVYINAWAIQRDPKNWENPDEFKPERFEHNQDGFKVQDFHFIPFGFGRRGCPGMNFAITTIEYVLANILYWFDWKLPETDEGKQDIDMSEIFGFALTKKEPLLLKPILHFH
ncbi:unnamed protein product [Trifolium pratense]|uniref:Uncharacterized protein n=1 Tax=Trifolium pratense TaxID=57577 RepID=A0ACB0L795_TRIPR|nr:unnamed protein product [Trifolium pratense]